MKNNKSIKNKTQKISFSINELFWYGFIAMFITGAIGMFIGITIGLAI